MRDENGAFKGMRAVLRSVFGTNAGMPKPPRDLTDITRRIEAMGSVAEQVQPNLTPARTLHEALLLLNRKAD